MKLEQFLVLTAGALVAVVMVVLGLWQMQVFLDQGVDTARERAESEPVPLDTVVADSANVAEGYGRPVTAQGRFLPEQQVIARDSDGTGRVVAALLLDEGSVVPVVLGQLNAQDSFTTPTGTASVTGVFLASDKTPDPLPQLAADEIAGVRLPVIAQQWHQPLVPGYITLSGDDSSKFGLQEAPLLLPSQTGSGRNEGYALQWWVFAIFAVAVSIKISRDLGKKNRTGSVAVTTSVEEIDQQEPSS